VILFRATTSAHPTVLSIAKQLGMFGPGTPYVWIFGIDIRFIYVNDATVLDDLRPSDFAGVFSLSPTSRPGDENNLRSESLIDVGEDVKTVESNENNFVLTEANNNGNRSNDDQLH
jgi:hypothetical protein